MLVGAFSFSISWRLALAALIIALLVASYFVDLNFDQDTP